jgi:hypothetical protein
MFSCVEHFRATHSRDGASFHAVIGPVTVADAVTDAVTADVPALAAGAPGGEASPVPHEPSSGIRQRQALCPRILPIHE